MKLVYNDKDNCWHQINFYILADDEYTASCLGEAIKEAITDLRFPEVKEGKATIRVEEIELVNLSPAENRRWGKLYDPNSLISAVIEIVRNKYSNIRAHMYRDEVHCFSKN